MPTGTSPAFDLTRAFSFPFQDPNWVPKFLIGSLFVFLSPLIIGSIFLIGYGLLVARQQISSETLSLPEWDDLGSILVDGVKGLAISVAHKLPLFLLTLLLALSLFGGVLFSRDGGDFSDALLFVGLPAVMAGSVLVGLLSLTILVYVPAAFVRFVQTGELTAAFDVVDIIGFIRANSSNYLIGLLTMLIASIGGQLGFLFFCIGVLPATFWSVCVAGYAVGELARLDVSPPSPTSAH